MRIQLSKNPEAGNKPYEAELNPTPSKLLERAVHMRDNGTCADCGFRSAKYMRTKAIKEYPIAPADYVTVCNFCWQVDHLDAAAKQRSAELIWMPEIDQRELNRAFPAIYVERLNSRSLAPQPIRALLKLFKERRIKAMKVLGEKETATLRDLFKEYPVGTPPCLENLSDEFRLWPLDRLIVRAGHLEFNQFPQILAFYRSKSGPLAGGAPTTAHTIHDWLQRLDVK